MLFAIDVDGVIATYQGTNAYAYYLHQTLGLTIPEDWRQGPEGYRELSRFDTVQAYALLSEAHKARFKAICQEGQFSALVQERAVPVAGALEAMQQLAQQGPLIYVTCRLETTRATSSAWLARYGFPHADQVYCCETYYHKYIAAYQQAQRRERIVLVDDRVRDMVLSFRGLVEHRRDVAAAVCKRIALVAFGYHHLPQLPSRLPSRLPFPVIALPSWDHNALLQLPQIEESVASRAPTP